MQLNKIMKACGLGLALTPVAMINLAQAAEQATAEEQEVERITVTGSNLRGVDMEGALPVIALDEDDIRASGATTVFELLRQVPQFSGGTGTFSTSTSGAKQGDSPAGASGISLRGLGTSSTLTLINGRRVSVSSFANGNESFVDVNAIPLSAIERVEILTSGASAVYGADAVAGVVNFILKQDFEGVELNMSYGDSDASSDDSRTNINLIYGAQSDKASFLAVIDYFDRNALYDRDRSVTAVEPRPSQQGIYPSFNDLWAMGPDFVEDSCPDAQKGVGSFGEYCELNRNAYTVTTPEMESYNGVFTFDYEFSSELRWFNELIISQKESSTNSEPAPFSGNDAPVSYFHPNMPDELRDRFDDAGVDPGFPIFAWGRFPTPRTVEVDSDNIRFVTGLNGEINDWYWETSFQWGKNENTQLAREGIVNVEKFIAAINGELCADGSVGCDPDVDGLWYNVFGGQLDNDPMVVALLEEEVPREGESELMIFDAKISGELYELDAGPILVAFGAEYRDEEVEDNPAPLATADPDTGEVPVFGFGSTDAKADRYAYAIYSEFNIPILETLDITAALRYDDYESYGSDTSPKIGFRYQPLDSLVFRGAYAESFRAPSLAQVGAGTTLSSGDLPCSGEFLDTFCAGFEDDDFYLSEIYGNQDLDAETAESWDFGVVYSPTDNLTLKLDYWYYKHEDLVDTDDEDLFRAALAGLVPVVDEDELASGELGIETRGGAIGDPVEEIHLQLINIGYQKTDGIDFSATYYLDTTEYGDFSFLLDTTYLNKFEVQLSPTSEVEKRAGGWRYPRWVGSAKLRWAYQDFYSSLRVNYTHDYDDDFERSGVPAGRKVDDWTVVGLYLEYNIGDHSTIGFDIDNLLDDTPPVALGSAANVDLVNHDSMGRYYTLSYRLRF